MKCNAEKTFRQPSWKPKQAETAWPEDQQERLQQHAQAISLGVCDRTVLDDHDGRTRVPVFSALSKECVVSAGDRSHVRDGRSDKSI
jgi:hypothetical protein